MKVIVAGSRSITDRDLIDNAMYDWAFYQGEITEVVCGMAEGVDLIGKSLAEEYGIYVKEFPADWQKYGKSAGPIRNMEMAKYADGLLAIWDGKSRGTRHMIEYMMDYHKPIIVVTARSDQSQTTKES